MKKRNTINKLSWVIVLSLSTFNLSSQSIDSAIFNYTGFVQYITACSDSVTIMAWGGGGAGGGLDDFNGAGGGGGSYITSTIPITPGEVLSVIIGSGGGGGKGCVTATGGGAPGWGNGTFDGGRGGNSGAVGCSGGGGGGGGASAVLRGNAVLVVAGGGGGGSGGGQHSAGANGGGGGQDGNQVSGSCTVPGIAGGNTTSAGTQGVDMSASAGATGDGGGGGGGGGGYLGGTGGGVAATCDCGACGGGGGSSWSSMAGATIIIGNGQVPGNSTALPAKIAVGDTGSTSGGNGYIKLFWKRKLPTASINGTTTLCTGATAPLITFTGSNNIEPYTFTYSINGAPNLTISSPAGSNTATLTALISTAGTYTYHLTEVQGANPVIPPCVTTATVQAWGGGGSGSGANAGGGAAYASSILTVVPGNSYNVVIGAGGAIPALGSNGNNGSNSSFGGTTVVAAGGDGATTTGGGAGGTIAASTGTTVAAGGSGGTISATSTNAGGPGTANNSGNGGGGATSVFGIPLNSPASGGNGQVNIITNDNGVITTASYNTPGTYTWVNLCVPPIACSQTLSDSAVVTVTTCLTCTVAAVALTSAVGTDAQTLCINTALTPITYTVTGGGTGAGVTGLPTGITGVYAAGNVTISGTPSIAGTSNYTITVTGGCTPVTTTGSITVNPLPTVTVNDATICAGQSATLTASGATATGSSTNIFFNTIGTSTWTTPTGVTSVDVRCWGGGGAGGGTSAGAGGKVGGGGGGGAMTNATITVVPGTTYNIVIGAAAVGGNGAGPDGVASTFGSGSTLVTGMGGKGAAMDTGIGGAGGVGTYNGGNGGDVSPSTGDSGGGGGGAGATGPGGNGSSGGNFNAGGINISGGTGGLGGGGTGGLGSNAAPADGSPGSGIAAGGGGAVSGGFGAAQKGGNGTLGQVSLTYTPVGGASSYVWSDGSIATTLTASPATSTIYTVTGKTAGCTGTASSTVTVNPSQDATFSYTPSTVCKTGGTDPTPIITGTTGGIFAVSPAATINASSGVITLATMSLGTYTITYTTPGPCPDTKTFVLNIVNIPKADFTFGTYCQNDINPSPTFINGGSTGAFTSTAGLVFVSPVVVQGTVDLSASLPGTYSVTNNIVASGGCQAATFTNTITINAVPNTTMTSTVVCAGTPATLIAGGATTYFWSDNTTASSLTAILTNTTSYTVTGTTANCSSSATGTITVNPMPTVTVNTSSACGGIPQTITASGASTYSWSAGTPSGPGNESLIDSPVATTNYVVTGTTNGCTASNIGTIIVNPTPIVLAAGSAVCSGSPATLTANSPNLPGTTTFVWSTTATTQSITVNPPITTTYTVIGTALGCSGTAMPIVTLSTTPTITVTNATICAGQVGTLIASGATSYVWSPNIGSSATVSDSPIVTTQYNVTGIIGSCSGTNIGTINVNPMPTVTVNSAFICAGQPVTLNANGASSYTWSNGFIGSSLSTSPLSTTTYTVTGTTSGCSSSNITTIAVSPLPTITVMNASICQGFKATLTAGGATSYLWSTGSVIDSTTVNPKTTSTYTVIGTGGGCSNKAVDTVIVFPKPVARFNINPNPAKMLSPVVNFTNNSSSNVNYWFWNFGDGDSLGTNTPNPTHTYSVDTATYQVTLIVHNSGMCFDTITLESVIGPEFAFYIPNAFSPNGDGINDVFFAKGSGILEYQLSIFDRWGNFIFHSDDINKAWDGKANGGSELAQQDVYVWKVALKDVYNKKHNYVGTVTIVR